MDLEKKPPKWQLAYDKLWMKFRKKEFRFEDMTEVVFGGKVGEKEVKYASKLLNQLEDGGYLITRRAEYDRRVRIYRLLDPEKISNARAIYKKVYERDKSFTFKDLIKEAFSSLGWKYLYIKDSAQGHWTNYYRSIEVQHLSVDKEDLDGWIALFKFFGANLIVEGFLINKSKKESIHLHTDLELRKNQIGESNYQLPRYTIVEAFKEDLLAALAVLISQRERLDWKKTIKLAKSNGLINTLGFSLECINKESEKQVFPKKLLDKIKKREEIELIGKGSKTDMDYKNLGEKWNVKCYRADVYKKAVLDLVK